MGVDFWTVTMNNESEDKMHVVAKIMITKKQQKMTEIYGSNMVIR